MRANPGPHNIQCAPAPDGAHARQLRTHESFTDSLTSTPQGVRRRNERRATRARAAYHAFSSRIRTCHARAGSGIDQPARERALCYVGNGLRCRSEMCDHLGALTEIDDGSTGASLICEVLYSIFYT
eukprot:COSAG02_NODE_3855_length_6141_cov_16.381000_5_plen_127_part_00